MTPAARVQAAIDILDRWLRGADGMDRVLTAWGRQNRYAGSGDRRAIADLVYDALRRKRSAAWVAGGGDGSDGRAILRGLLILQGEDPEAFFTGDRHAPACLGPGEAATRCLANAPRGIRLDYPDWLEREAADLGDAALAALRDRAPLDLRVNLLKADRKAALTALAADGITAEPGPLSPTALRVTDGARRLRAGRAWRDGLVEIQDAASQAVADLAGALAGETILDLCAGGGGKTLALAAATGNQARLLAHDIDPARMADLPVRARRAGAAVEQVATAGLPGLHGSCDLVVVDAPCSGSGTWRRNPDSKWRLCPGQIERYCEIQAGLLDQASGLCAPDGRVLYTTCSLFDRENDGQIRGWLGRHPGWTCRARLALTPDDGGDGFFAAVLSPG